MEIAEEDHPIAGPQGDTSRHVSADSELLYTMRVRVRGQTEMGTGA